MNLVPGAFAYFRPDGWDELDRIPDAVDSEELKCVIVRASDGAFWYAELRDLALYKGRPCLSRATEGNLFTTAREAIISQAKDKQDYGTQCLEVAEKLRKLAESL